MMEWIGALKVAKDIVKGGISAYKAGEVVDALIAKSVDEYSSILTDNEKALHAQYKSETENEQKSKLRLSYLGTLAKNTSLPEDFRTQIENAAQEYRKAENFALESMEDTMMDYATTDDEKASLKKVVDEFKLK